MGDVRDILKGGIMSQSHPAPSREGPIPHSPSNDSWKWTEYKSQYRPFSQYTYSAGSWHRNTPLDTTDGPSSWYAEVAERIHKAEEYKTRSRSSGIGEADCPSEGNRLIWSNSVSALTLHDTVDSSAGHRRQKSGFHSLGPAFPPAKDNKPASATSAGRNAHKARTSRSVSRRRPESKDVPDSTTGATSPTKSSVRTQSSKPPVKKEADNKDAKNTKPRAVVKPTPAKEGDKIKEDKKWIKPAPSDTIDSKPKDTHTKDTKPATEKSPPKAAEISPAPAKTATPAAPAAKPAEAVPKPAAVSQPAKTETPKPAAVPEPVKPTESIKTPAPAQTVPASSGPVQPQTKPLIPEPVSKPAEKIEAKPSAVATPLIPSMVSNPVNSNPVVSNPVAAKTAPVDPMAQSFIDHSTIGGGGGGGGGGLTAGAKMAPKPADFSMAGSRLDGFWAEGK